MQSKMKGGFSSVLIALFVSAVVVLIAAFAYNNFAVRVGAPPVSSFIPSISKVSVGDLSKTDSFGDIETDLNSTNFDQLDADLLEVSSDLSSN